MSPKVKYFKSKPPWNSCYKIYGKSCWWWSEGHNRWEPTGDKAMQLRDIKNIKNDEACFERITEDEVFLELL